MLGYRINLIKCKSFMDKDINYNVFLRFTEKQSKYMKKIMERVISTTYFLDLFYSLLSKFRKGSFFSLSIYRRFGETES